jgi:hypothetical protein
VRFNFILPSNFDSPAITTTHAPPCCVIIIPGAIIKQQMNYSYERSIATAVYVFAYYNSSSIRLRLLSCKPSIRIRYRRVRGCRASGAAVHSKYYWYIYYNMMQSQPVDYLSHRYNIYICCCVVSYIIIYIYRYIL